jgi:hypothetical protein
MIQVKMKLGKDTVMVHKSKVESAENRGWKTVEAQKPKQSKTTNTEVK